MLGAKNVRHFVFVAFALGRFSNGSNFYMMSPHMSKKYVIGVDMTEVAKFRGLKSKSQSRLLNKLFTKKEIVYCFGYKRPEEHLAGTFAAKEAASKALGTDKFPFVSLEIRRAKNGKPEVWKSNKKLPVDISITHAGKFAVAVAVA